MTEGFAQWCNRAKPFWSALKMRSQILTSAFVEKCAMTSAGLQQTVLLGCSGQPQCNRRYAAGRSWEERDALCWLLWGLWWTAAPYALGNKGVQCYWVEICSTGSFLLLFVSASIHARVMYIPFCAQCSSLGDTTCFSLSSLAWFSLWCRNCAFSLWQRFLGEHSQRCSFQVGH